MDLADEDRDGAGRGRLLAHQIGAEAIVRLGAALDQPAERRQGGERGGVLRRRRGPCDGLRREAGRSEQCAEDHSTFRLSRRIKVDHLVSSWSMSLAYSSGL